ncbi:uncharacterized protein F5147DRAFT_587475 [Suillus discolor]|uniref:Uncharacterized protein n=1 Tax=Suillus discolor TaxID=1912936 RepID=A0A9P7EUC7_9AGAM|nr:uncharacterized protein F5147DRAFT_587475 [Suillus discolor]KAG2088739.1 hypothetical protein F5147DRAFT_587475 [Suillus discolor]
MSTLVQANILVNENIERLMKEWTSPVYAFFDPTPRIIENDGCWAHEFKCSARGCKTTIRRYLDKKDARSTGNMRKHVKSCWGDVVLQAADDAKDASEVHTKIIPGILRNRSITASFERKGKGKVTYSNRQHTRAETKGPSEYISYHPLSIILHSSPTPFEIVKDRGFQSLMKTGRPEYYLPSPTTISCDVRLVFACTRQHIAKMLREYEGKINFTMDTWTSTNHRAFVAVSVHLEHNGVPLSLPLDIVEVAKVC